MSDHSTETGDVVDDQTRRRFLGRSALATGALAIGGTGLAVGSDAQAKAPDDTSEGGRFGTVEFPNQRSGGTEIVADRTIVSEGGYVTYHDPSLFDAKPLESVVGITDYLEAGIHYEVSTSLFDVPGADHETTALTGTSPLVAMPHRETTGDEQYDFVLSGGTEDRQYTRAGLPVVDLGFVTADDRPPETGQRFAQTGFWNQSLAEGTVTVREAVLSEGGFVTLHDVRFLRGKPFASVVGVSEYLEPGLHQDVQVPIESPDEIATVAFPPAPPLIAMPHRDTNGNREYDFVSSQGEADPPYTNAGRSVVDLAFVKTGS